MQAKVSPYSGFTAVRQASGSLWMTRSCVIVMAWCS